MTIYIFVPLLYAFAQCENVKFGLCAGSGCVHRRAWASPSGRTRSRSRTSVDCHCFAGGGQLSSVRSSINDQLRTGTDKLVATNEWRVSNETFDSSLTKGLFGVWNGSGRSNPFTDRTGWSQRSSRTNAALVSDNWQRNWRLRCWQSWKDANPRR
jgi:hypothetical protein